MRIFQIFLVVLSALACEGGKLLARSGPFVGCVNQAERTVRAWKIATLRAGECAPQVDPVAVRAVLVTSPERACQTIMMDVPQCDAVVASVLRCCEPDDGGAR